MDNREALKKGMQKAKELCYDKILEKFEIWGNMLIEDAEDQKEYANFTGNTITSLAFGLYYGGYLDTISFIDGKNPPIRAKVAKGVTVILPTDYDGYKNSSVTGMVDLATEYGSELSVQTLQQIKPKGGFGIVVCTGTEYSVILEDRDLNVLSETSNNAEMYSYQWFANIINNRQNIPINKL